MRPRRAGEFSLDNLESLFDDDSPSAATTAQRPRTLDDELDELLGPETDEEKNLDLDELLAAGGDCSRLAAPARKRNPPPLRLSFASDVATDDLFEYDAPGPPLAPPKKSSSTKIVPPPKASPSPKASAKPKAKPVRAEPRTAPLPKGHAGHRSTTPRDAETKLSQSAADAALDEMLGGDEFDLGSLFADSTPLKPADSPTPSVIRSAMGGVRAAGMGEGRPSSRLSDDDDDDWYEDVSRT